MQIGSEQGQMVFQAREGGDTFLVLCPEERVLRLYKTEETLLCPRPTVFEEYMDRPYFWSEATGMMSVLSEVSWCNVENVTDRHSAEGAIEGLEAYLDTV